jgi:hypothetical protein
MAGERVNRTTANNGEAETGDEPHRFNRLLRYISNGAVTTWSLQ